MFDKKVFCKGLLCHKNDRVKCNDCGIYACKGNCAYKFKGKYYCIDCYLEKLIDIWSKKIEIYIKKN